nr:MAG TPA: hypothetical protein [Caudoviricetes sp.]
MDAIKCCSRLFPLPTFYHSYFLLFSTILQYLAAFGCH